LYTHIHHLPFEQAIDRIREEIRRGVTQFGLVADRSPGSSLWQLSHAPRPGERPVPKPVAKKPEHVPTALDGVAEDQIVRGPGDVA
jgi:hypothetical protein